MKKRTDKSIITQTVFRISAICITTILVLSVMFAIFMGIYLRNNIMESKEEQIDNISMTAESLVESLTYPMVSLAKYNPTIRVLSNYNEKYSVEWMGNIRNIDVFLTNVSMFNDHIIDINLIQPDSTVSYSMNDALKRDYTYIEQEWFQKALDNKGIIKYVPPHGTDYYYSKGKPDSFNAFYPIYRSGKTIGYVFVDCDLSQIAEYFKEEKDEESGFILLDGDGELIYDYKENRKDSVFMGTKELMNLKAGEKVNFQEKGKLYIAYRLPSTNWVILSENDSRMIIQPIINLLSIVLPVIIIVIISMIGVAVHSGKIIEKPFNALIARIVSYDGSSSVEVSEFEDAPRELRVIRKRFEQMADKINALIYDVYIAKLSRKEMELEALTNQINPHFIYNVFQLIQTKAVIVDDFEVEEMIQALSKMMRYTMERGTDKVKIAAELEYIDYYLMFYKERFTSMFEYEIICEEELKQCMTTKFILQPVVENCFKHAFKDRKEGGIVRIRVESRQRDILITIWDNGCGMEKSRLEVLHNRLNDNLAEGGIGIINTNARIRLVYGSPYQLSIQSRENEYTEVKIIIPIEEEFHV